MALNQQIMILINNWELRANDVYQNFKNMKNKNNKIKNKKFENELKNAGRLFFR